jgi:hypothetical protein
MSRIVLYAVISIFVITAAVLAYVLYQEQQTTSGIEIGVGKDKISIETK